MCRHVRTQRAWHAAHHAVPEVLAIGRLSLVNSNTRAKGTTAKEAGSTGSTACKSRPATGLSAATAHALEKYSQLDTYLPTCMQALVWSLGHEMTGRSPLLATICMHACSETALATRPICTALHAWRGIPIGTTNAWPQATPSVIIVQGSSPVLSALQCRH